MNRTNARKRFSVIRNERLTALTGAVLFVLIVTELVITANLHALISVHIFVGVLLAGPLMVKLGSTGYKFFRYYSGSSAYVENGPPHILLRLLGPLVLITTLAVFISGFGLAIAGPAHEGLFFLAHAASVAMWLPLIAVHIYAHIRKVPRLISEDLGNQPANRVSGRAGRVYLNIGALIVGLIAAILMMPVSVPWDHFRIPNELPSPLVAGVMAAIFGVFVATKLLPKSNPPKPRLPKTGNRFNREY